MLFSIFVQISGDGFHGQPTYTLSIIEADSVEAAAAALGVAIDDEDENGCATIIDCPEAMYRLRAKKIWLSPIYADSPATLVERMDRSVGVNHPLMIKEREDWLCSYEYSEAEMSQGAQ